MNSKKIDPGHLEKLNDPRRLKIQDPHLIWETLAVKDPRVLVEIGVGTGFFAFPFSEKLRNGAVYALDISEQMLSWLKEHRPEKDTVPLVPIRMGENRIPLKKNIADLVYMVNLHHELEEPEKIMAEAFRVLKNRGKIAVIDWEKEAAYGPPPSIRVAKETVRSQLLQVGLKQIIDHDILPYHYFLVGEKREEEG